ncbi:MAG: PilX N-terminal domain-containing pilus assembly protein [Rubrivivax sp.]|jgi:hypothetical protein|nr:PilX N-terminal domain-containing pilus assembly protein [Rubrivivax sp.]
MPLRRLPRSTACTPRQQRGIATLLVVMALFFLVSMVAAYTSRNLIFEQRTSANQYRATQAFEAAEGGVEWALAQLNGSRVDASCATSTDINRDTFRSRYLVFDLGRGTVSPQRWVSPDGPLRLAPGCSRTAAGWQCSCPSNGPPTLVGADGGTVQPSFRVLFEGDTSTPGVLRVDVIGCTSPSETCLSLGQGSGNEAAARLNVTLVMLPALASTPAAALTVRGAVTLDTPAIAINDNAGTNGLSVHAGGLVQSGDITALSMPGSPGAGVIADNDTAMANTPPDRFFAGFFGLSRAAFARQPAVSSFTCRGGCGDSLRAHVRANPGRPIWVADDLVIDSAGDIGTPDTPVLLVVNGQASWATSGINLHGVVYAQGAAASNGSSANWVQGALISENAINAPTLPGTRYDANVIQRIRQQQGSVIRLPGGWRDF